MNTFTCVIASHISTLARLRTLEEAIDSALLYFSVILSFSCERTLKEAIDELLLKYSSVIKVFSEVKKSQFQHINDAFSYVASERVIFLDDDDKFLPPIIEMLPLLLQRYGQHEGVQLTYENGITYGNIDTDFSGTFCGTLTLGVFLTQESENLSVYDLDCVFREFISMNSRGLPNYNDDFGIDDDIVPFVYKREDDEVTKDW